VEAALTLAKPSYTTYSKVPREAKIHGGREVGDENGDGRKKGVSLAVAVQ